MNNYCSKNTYKILFVVFTFQLTFNISAQENKLFWDGRDWNNIPKMMDYDLESTIRVKMAYLNGLLDGRLFSYLKVWNEDQILADNVFSETVDYLSTRELIKNIDFFYNDPLNNYVPMPSAIIIANMYAERLPIQSIEIYIESTRRWINDLILDLDTLNYSKLLEEKLIRHQKKIN
tara:strand:+ start:458 stop:985 length:528 start_codon:yes stop_codon:yes gene_type:complete